MTPEQIIAARAVNTERARRYRETHREQLREYDRAYRARKREAVES